MSGLPDDAPVESIFIPGSHDSASARVFCPAIARCQSLTIAEQLEAGCRFFDLRLSVRGERLFAVHGFAPCYSPEKNLKTPYPAEEIFSVLISFLTAHPSETVLISVQQDGSQDPLFPTLLYENHIEKYKAHFYLKNALPRLAEVRGKLVLLRRFEAPDDGDLTGGINVFDDWTSRHPKPGASRTAAIRGCARGEARAPFCLQDEFTYGVRKKWALAVKPMIDRGARPGELFLNYLSCTGRLSPKAAAIPLNEKFLAEPTLRGGGIYIFDFFTPALAKKVYDFNFIS